MLKLSVLVPTVPSRILTTYPALLQSLLEQVNGRTDVEVLGFFDNKQRPVGDKRNDLLGLSRGEYVVFVDDDDRVGDDYVSSILDALYENPEVDCVVFDSLVTYLSEGNKQVHCKYSIHYDYRSEGNMWWGKPAHTMVYKASIAKAHIFKPWDEDIDWVARACKDINTEVHIDKILYFYDYDAESSETSKRTSGV